jgi:hypothetical protein
MLDVAPMDLLRAYVAVCVEVEGRPVAPILDDLVAALDRWERRHEGDLERSTSSARSASSPLPRPGASDRAEHHQTGCPSSLSRRHGAPCLSQTPGRFADQDTTGS